VVASEPGWQTQLGSLRTELDELQPKLAALTAQQAEIELILERRGAGGVRAALGNWLGRPVEEHTAEATRLAGELGAIQARLDELTVSERELQARIAAATLARAELAAMRDRAVEALRAMPGPIGDEIRALDTEDAQDRKRLAAIVEVVELVEHARAAVEEIDAAAINLRQRERAAELLDGRTWPFESPAQQALQAARSRLSEAVGEAALRLRAVDRRFGATACAWAGDLSIAKLIELVSGARYLDSITELRCLAHVAGMQRSLTDTAVELGVVRGRLTDHVANREARRRELLEL